MPPQVTYQRLKDTLERMSKVGAGSSNAPGAPLVDVLFGVRGPRFVDPHPAWKPHNVKLDESQRKAVGRALAAKDVALLHGPPGVCALLHGPTIVCALLPSPCSPKSVGQTAQTPRAWLHPNP